ncbi:MAG TPA: carboxypeptidase regulatory-like domain-containing protein [Pyrinomonadaceae bacterium]|nr:carboxypeptidase regulatory-like domain-containing protein [Pyrinomonadaceae bacterium]
MRQPLKFIGGLAAALALSALLPATPALAQGHYRVVQSTGAAVVPGTELLAGSRCDDCVAPVTLPFAFTHYGQTFPAGSVAHVSSNGNLQFATADGDYGRFSVCFPLAQFGSSILAHWTDLQTDEPGEGVFTSVTGAAPNRTFNIEWRASYQFFTPGSINFEIRLFETPGADGRRFEIVYGTLGASATTAPGQGFSLPAVGAQGPGGAQHTGVSSECAVAGGGLRAGTRLAFIDAPSLSIHGRVTNPDGQPLGGVTVTLSGSASASQTTAADGYYSFAGLTAGASYAVAASDGAASSYHPRARQFQAGTSVASLNGSKVVNFVRTPAPGPGDLIVSEFRFRGPGIVITEDFVELYNNTDSAIVVHATDTNSAGWLVVSPNNRHLVIPNGTVIPARRHFLIAGTGYNNLYQYAPGDEFYSGDMPNDSGVAVFSTTFVDLSTPAGRTAALAKRLDAAGFTTACQQGVDPCVFREGAGLAPLGPAAVGVDTEYSFVRKFAFGRPVDTDDNAADFQLVSTGGGMIGGSQSILGAPGPENLYGPAERNARFKASFVSACTGQSSDPDSTCARVRLQASDPAEPNNTTQGTLLIRRRWTNRTGAPVAHLRFRVVDITTLNSPGYAPGNEQADLRVLDSANRTVGAGTLALKGMTVEDAPPAQPSGGGLNASLRVGDVTLASPLAHNASINVEFRLGVVQPGIFRFVLNVETLGDEPLSDTPGGSAPTRPPSQPSAKRVVNK